MSNVNNTRRICRPSVSQFLLSLRSALILSFRLERLDHELSSSNRFLAVVKNEAHFPAFGVRRFADPFQSESLPSYFLVYGFDAGLKMRN